MGLEAAELARWTRFAAKGGIGKCTALCDCVAESPDDLMFLKDDEITVLYQLPEHDGLFLGYCEGVVGRFNGSDVQIHGKLKKPVMAKRSSVSTSSTIAKSPSPSNMAKVPPSSPSPAPSPRPPSVSTRRSSAVSRRDSDGAGAGGGSTGVMERRGSTTGSGARRLMSPLSSTVLNLEDEEQYRPTTANMPHMSHSSTSTVADSAGINTPAHTHFPSNQHEKQSPQEFQFPRPPQQPPYSGSSSSSRATSPPTFSVSHSETVPLSTIHRYDSTSSSHIPSSLNLLPDSYSNDGLNSSGLGSGTSPLRIAKKSPTSPTVPAMHAQVSSPPQAPPPELPSLSLLSTTAHIPNASISSTTSSPLFLTQEHTDRFNLENDISGGEEHDDTHGIGLSLLRGLVGELDSDDSDDDSDSWSRSGAGRGGIEHGGQDEDDEAYAAALSRVGRTDRDSLDESTIEGLGYARSEDSHHYPQPQQPPTQTSPPPLPVSNTHHQHLSPTQSPTSPSFPSQQHQRQSQHSQYSQNQQQPIPRERRPSMTPSATSNGSGSGSQAGTIGEWEGYSDIYDDYRYSRYSVASKLSFGLGSSRASIGAASAFGHDALPPPVPDPSSRPSVDGFGVGRPSLDGSVRQRVGSGTDRDRMDNASVRSRTDSSNSNANPNHGRVTSLQGQGQAQGQGLVAQPIPALSRRSLFKDRTMSTDSDASVYTQNSRLSTLSQDAVALMSNNILTSSGIGNEISENSDNGDTEDPTYKATATTARTRSTTSGSYHNQRPAPLNLIQSNAREPGLENDQNESTAQPQPLLNTTWGSPLSSPGVPSPKSSSVLYTPLPGVVAQGNARDSIVGFGALGAAAGGGGMQAALVSPTFGGGFASAMRQRLEEEDRDRREEDASNSTSDTVGDTTTSTIVSGAGLGNRIVVEDEEELPSRAIADGSMIDTTQDLSSSSIFLETNTSTPNSTSTPHSASPERDLLFGQHLAPLVVANRTPSPSILEGGSDDGGQFLRGQEGVEATEGEEPGAEAFEREAEEGTEGRTSPSPLPPSHLRPSLAQLREGAGELVPGTNQRRSLFLPHPNAPKSPPAGVANSGPMFIAAQQGSLPPHQQPPPSQQMNMQQQSLNLQPGQVLPPQYNQQQRPPRPHLFGVIHQALSMPPRPPPPPSGPPGPNGIRPPVLPRGPTIYGRTEGDLASANGPIPMIWSVDPPPATAPPHANVKVGGNGTGKGATVGMASPPRVQMMAKRPPRSMSLGPGAAGANAAGNAGVGAGGAMIEKGLHSGGTSVTEGAAKTSSEKPPDAVKDVGGEQATAGSGVIPRANFTPKTPGLRPRSRSFSGFNSTSAEVTIPIQRREDGETISSRDVKRSLTTASLTVPLSSSIPSPSSTKPILGSSPLRPSPLSLNASTRSSENLSVKPPLGSPLIKPPSSPLATSSIFGSVPSTTRTTPSSPTIASAPSSPAFGSFNTKQLRQSASRSTLGDGVSSSARNGPGLRSNPSDGGVGGAQANFSNRVASLQLPSLRPDAKNLDNSDAVSIHSTRSQVIPQTSGQSVVRQTSLRSKLSLPNLRRKHARGMDDELAPSSPTTPHASNMESNYSEMLQVHHMEFELVRPSLSHFNQHNFNGAARASEDSGVLGREHSMSLDGGQSAVGNASAGSGGGFLRAESPAMSISSSGIGNGRFSEQRSPVGEPGVGSNWPPASSSRPTTDNESLSASSSMDAHRQRELKWMNLMQTNEASQARKSKKVRKLVVDGVPSSVRYLVWSHLTDGKARYVAGVYGKLGNRGKVASSAEIERDIKVLFDDDKERTGHLQGTQGPVLGLLQAYLNMVPDVVYSKGLTLIVGQLLLLAPEEDAFWTFVSIMDTHIRSYFSSSTTQMEVDSALFSRALEVNDPPVAKKLFVDMGILPSTICQPWFSTLFVNILPPEYVNRVWDMFLYEGVPFLIRVALALITCCKRDILTSTSETTILTLLSHPPQSFLPSSPDSFLALTFAVKLKDDDVRKQRVKMEAQVKRQTQHSQPPPRASSGLISLPRSS